MLLDIERTEHEGMVVLAVLGDLDVASAPLLRTQVIEAVNSGPSGLVLDLRKVAFIDSFGLGAVISAHKRSSARQSEPATEPPAIRPLMVLVDPDGPVATLLQLTQLDSILDVRPDLETARVGE